MDLALPTTPAPANSTPSSEITAPATRSSRSRTQSISSDRPSTVAYSLMSPPLSVSPEAAFIAVSAGSQIVANDHDSHVDRWYDQHGMEPSAEAALVSPAALSLVNNFLDQLLFNFLCVAKSTSLASLRPAVSEVLKPKLAKDAVNLADEELCEYLGSGDDDDDILQTATDPGSDWDLELVWKRTRLRCMVYSSLGDVEEEDEDYYMEQEHLEEAGRVSEVVSPAVAIFLTSILEFMGEQALTVAGQAAFHRMRIRHEKELKEGLRSPSAVSDRIVVEELDMERVALDRTLGRLWRAWKKRIRSPGLDHHGLQRAFSRSSIRSGSFHSAHLRQESMIADHDMASLTRSAVEETNEEGEQSLQDSVEEWVRASQIPLPLQDGDVDEIEVPGLALYSDDEDDEVVQGEEDLDLKPRPKSLMIPPTATTDLPTPITSQPVTPVIQTRKRSNSLPTPATSPYHPPPKRSNVAQKMPARLESDAPVEFAPVSMEESSPEAPDTGESPEEAAPVTSATTATAATAATGATGATVPTPMGEELGPDPTLRARKVASRSGRLAEVPAQPAVGEADGAAEVIEGDIEEFAEEPEVLNFSRVSVADRISPTSSSSDSGSGSRSQPANPAMPVRTPSIRSARLVDVATPRSQISRQRSPSADRRPSQDHDHVAVVLPPAIITSSRVSPDVSRTNSHSPQPPIAEEPTVKPRTEQPGVSPVSRAAAPSPLSRKVPPMTAAPPARSSSRQPPNPLKLPLREDSAPSSRKPVPGQALKTPTETAQPIFGSASRQSPEHSSPRSNRQPLPAAAAAAVTKVTILTSSHGSSSLDVEDRQYSRREVRDVLPPVPERSNAQSNGGATSQQSNGASSIVEPSVYGRESPKRPSMDTRGGAPRSRHHASENSASSSVSGGKYKPIRTSEESTKARVTVARDFEELMKSDTTIQYTLTPENMRDMDSQSTRSLSNASPIIPVKFRKSEDRPTAARSRSSSDNTKPIDLRRSGSVQKPTHVSSHAAFDLQGSVPRASSIAMSSNGRGAGAQPRDARVARDSMADFAKWIRSSGPDGASDPAPPMSGAVGEARNTTGAASITPKPSMDTTHPVGTSSSAGTSSTTRPKLLARDATVSSQDETSDLIDFIRRGPPSTNPRIPRAVAPFRSTMDSDQLAAAIGGKAVDANLPDVRHSGGTAQTEPSINSSVDSRSALLASTNKPGRAASGYGSASVGREEDGMPRRNRRGPRDPYAIDLSDDGSDADLFDRPPPKPAQKEESMAEFLMSYEPPPSAHDMSPPPPPPPPPHSKKPKKKLSAPSLMARFTRSHYHQHSPLSRSVPHSATGSANGLDASSVSSKATNGTGKGGYVPIQVSMPHGSQSYGNGGKGGGSSAVGSAVSSARSNLSTQSGPAVVGRRVPMKRFEPREAVNVTSRTNDLADFLKNSGPSDGVSGAAVSAPNLDPDGRPHRRRMKF